MIVIYINGEGTAEKLSPQHVYQGSNQTGVTVFAPVPSTTSMGIAFRLPDKTSTPYYTMTYVQNVEGLTQYEFTIPSSITQKVGKSAIALQMLFSDGQQTSQRIEFEIEPSVLPVLPDEPTADVYDILRQRVSTNEVNISTLQGQIGHIEELSESSQEASQNAVQTSQEAKATADGLADSIAQANTTSQKALDTASNTAEEVNEFKQSVTQEITEFESGVNTTIDNFKNDVNNEVSEFESGVNDKLDKFEEQLADTGTIIKVDGVSQKEISFTSDPQTQIDSLQTEVSERATTTALEDEVTARQEADNELQTQLNNKVEYIGSPQDYDTAFNNTRLSQSYDTRGVSPSKPTDSGHWVIGAQSSANYGSQMACSDNGNIYFRKLANGTWSSWERLLKTDPTKLTPSTANGWTVGGDTLKLPSAGIYLLSINNQLPSLIVLPEASTTQVAAYNTFSVAVNNAVSVLGTVSYWIYRNGSVSWNTARALDGTSYTDVNITSVAYKKLI